MHLSQAWQLECSSEVTLAQNPHQDQTWVRGTCCVKLLKKEKPLSPEFAVFLSAAAEIESLKETQTVKQAGRQLCV